MKKLFTRQPPASSPHPRSNQHEESSTASDSTLQSFVMDGSRPIGYTPAELTAEYLNDSQKRGVAGLCACLLPAVQDGSTELTWSKLYLKLVVEVFLGLPSSQTEAYLPILTARKTELDSKALEPCNATVEELDPAPFLTLLHPDSETKSSGLKGWTRKLKQKATHQDTPESPSNLTVHSFRLKMVKRLLWFTVKAVGYDARARTLLRLLVVAMELEWSSITREEVEIGGALYAEATAMPTEKVAAKPKMRDWKRNAAIGAAAVTGGALLAVTGGLAAPAIAASLTALGGAGVAIGAVVGSAAGVTATTILFGTAGAGVVGMKADSRTRGVHEFHFDLVSAGDGMNVYICVSGWLDDDDPPKRGFRRAWGDSREYLRAFYRDRNPDKVETVDQVMDRYNGREDEFFRILRNTYHIETGSMENDPLGIADQSSMEAAEADNEAQLIDDTTVNSVNSSETATASRSSSSGNRNVIPSSASRLSTAVWELGTSREPLRAWRWKDRFPQGDQYCLMWEESELRRFGKSMRTFTSEKVSSYATSEIVKYTALAALFTAVAIPRTILKLADIIDNSWVLTMNAADESGKLLADALRRREQGLRPVTLVGYGMGARLIFSCLKELANSEEPDQSCGIVENAVLLGSPVPMAKEDWANARRMVSGRIINGYSSKDWMLGVMYRYQGWALNSAGIAPIDIAGVENVDLSSLIGGHLEYKSKIGAIMDLLKLEG